MLFCRMVAFLDDEEDFVQIKESNSKMDGLGGQEAPLKDWKMPEDAPFMWGMLGGGGQYPAGEAEIIHDLLFDNITAFTTTIINNDTDTNLVVMNSSTTTASSATTTTTTTTLSGLTASFETVFYDYDENDTECSDTNSFTVALPWIRIIFGLLMMLENSVSLAALWRVKRMQTAVHKFISSLAVAELLMGVWCCYRYGVEILMGSDPATVECRLRFVGNTYLNFAAILSVAALCVDRCIALHWPFRYGETVTTRRVRWALGVIWVLPLAFVLTAYVDTHRSPEDRQEDHRRSRDCSFIHIASQRTYVVLTVVRCVLISLIIACELLIFRAARGQIVKIYPHALSSRNNNRFLRVNAKAAITTLAVVVPFLLLYFPVLLVQGNLAARPHAAGTCQNQLLDFVWLFASAHGLFTPIIFCWRFTEVRENLVRMLRCCWAAQQPAPSLGVFHLRTNESRSASTA